jgi:hypothetical protein
MSPRLRSLLVSFGIGAGISIVAALLLKRQLEQEFGAGARDLEAHLADRGSALRTQITAEATAAGRQAAIQALNEYGITPQLVSRIQTLASHFS